MNNKHINWILKELPDLVSQGVISAETGERLRQHYSSAGKEQTKKTAIVLFSIIGSVLIGGGIILILAHNWEEISRPFRAIISITPLLLIQILGIWMISNDKMTIAWREGIGTFQTLAMGSAIALISQTYHLGGTVEEFLLCWSLLTLPLAYILRTIFTILLYLVGVTSWTITVANSETQKFLFFPLIALSLPFLFITIREYHKYHPRTLLVLSGFTLAFIIGTLAILSPLFHSFSVYTGACLLVFTVVFLVGMQWYHEVQSISDAPIQGLGTLGLVAVSLLMSFNYFWEDIGNEYVVPFSDYLFESIICGVFLIVYLILWIECILKKKWTELIIGFAPFGFLIGCVLENSSLASLIFTIYLMAFGVTILSKGLQQKKLKPVNLGMLIISVVIIAKFFESDINFVAKGLAFIVTGTIFLATNLYLKRLKGGEQ